MWVNDFGPDYVHANTIIEGPDKVQRERQKKDRQANSERERQKRTFNVMLVCLSSSL